MEIKVKCPAKTTSALGEGNEPLEMRRPELVSGSQELRVKCPAKINLTLEILNKREDGFHNIQSVMQTINLFDILTIKVEKSEKFEIKLSGTSTEIPYDERNLVHKAILLFMNTLGARGDGSICQPKAISVYIKKNIPISAGLAGGSTDAAGALWGLNKLFQNPFSKEELHELCAQLGSDLNFCLEGGCQLATSRGEILEKLPFYEFELSLIKPKNVGISAKEAYTKFSQLEKKPDLNMTKELVEALKSGEADVSDIDYSLHNDLELALIEDYEEFQAIKMEYPEAIMSGSGSTFFMLTHNFKDFDKSFWIKPNLKSTPYGVCEV